MSDKKYDVLVFIGRFQPFHNGHKVVVDHALNLSERVVVFVGSANRSRSERNPFTFEERKQMIRASYSDGENDRIMIMPLDDIMYNDDRWVESVQTKVYYSVLQSINPDNPHIALHGTNDAKVGLIGCEKDGTSFYLKLFPTWGSEKVEFQNPINATDIRNEYFAQLSNRRKYPVPDAVHGLMEEFEDSEHYEYVTNEIEFNWDYKETVKKYPRIEHTVDAVVIQSAHVLLIRRRSYPGKGKWALPGGFVNPDETLVKSAIRELKEETKIKVPEAVLYGSIVKEKTYDDPHRSDRGRIITQAYLIRLRDETSLPKVKGSDDADKARWVPLGELNPVDFFEDHYHIIQDLVGEL